MRLTTCRDCKDTISKQAKSCPHCGAPVVQKTGCGTILLAIVLGTAIGVWVLYRADFSRIQVTPTTSSTTAPSTRPDDISMSLSVGDIGFVRNGKQLVQAGATSAAYDRLVQLQTANDNEGIARMALAGQVMLIEDGTKCRIIGIGFFSYEIRLLNGDYSGKSGFIPMEWVVRVDALQRLGGVMGLRGRSAFRLISCWLGVRHCFSFGGW
jgi:hypothetical protein